ncbi:T9SS type A sorting domain-containing protein [Flavobacterium sp.]|uniref:T9SS type A sorting domain-containing protein n=1 Tax=Flavobacterium sp. TaxID=239 RepID=UPI002FDA4AF8
MNKIKLLFFLLFTINSNAQQSLVLDSSFGVNGVKVVDLGYDNYHSRDVVVQNDGKIVVFGDAENIGQSSVGFVVRFNQNGSIDTNFGTDGHLITDRGVGVYAKSLYAIPSGKLLLLSENSVKQYNSDGSLDLTFGNLGSIEKYMPSIAIQNDGKIIIAYRFFTFVGNRIKIERYYPDGTIDDTFNVNNTIFGESIYGGVDTPAKVIVRSDDKIILVDEIQNSSFYSFKITRLNPDGTPDGAEITSNGNMGMNGVYYELQNDDKLLVGAFDYHTIKAKKYNSDFSFDNSFGVAGVSSVFPNNTRTIALQNDNKPFVIHNYGNGGIYTTTIYRINTDGTLDATFDNDGTQNIQIATNTALFMNFYITNNSIITLGDTWTTAPGLKGFFIEKYNITTALANPENQLTKQLSFFPNPVNDVITFTNIEAGESIKITDMTGKIIINQILGSDKKINVEMLSKGLYLIHLNNTKSIKFIKE